MKPVSAMPKVNSAKLTIENRVFIHPVCALGGNEFIVNKGWKLVGWSSAPTKGAGPHAIVYEMVTPTLDYQSFSVGCLYWGHGHADKMFFHDKLPEECEDELGPWLK